MPPDKDTDQPTPQDHGGNVGHSPAGHAQKSDPSAPTILTTGDISLERGIAPLLIGSTLEGRYLIEKRIGQGGMGQVYLAKDLQLHQRPVVVKVLLEEAYENPYMLKKFHQEIEALSRIDHPGVIGIVDAGEVAEAKPFIVMQYVDGVNLRSEIRNEGMNLERVADLIRHIGRALTAAHEKGILHRDLKPENIMLQDLGHGEELVKIIDFGIARIKQSVIAPTTATTATAGTISYMSPEQLSAKPVSAATDIYSLGNIAYEMVTGRRAFNPETAFELLDMQRAGVRVRPVDLRPSLPLPAQQSILKALAFEPRDRYRSAREFSDELAVALLTPEDTLSLDDSRSNALAPTLITSHERVMPTSPGGMTTAAGAPVASGLSAIGHQPSPPGKSPRVAFSINTSWFKIAIGLFSLVIVGSASYGVLMNSWSNKSLVANNSNRSVTTGPKPPPLIATSNNNSSTSANSSAPLNARTAPDLRILTYWLTVEKMRDAVRDRKSSESSDQEVFNAGDQVRLNVVSQQPGYLYLFDEDIDKKGEKRFTILFPMPTTNGSSAGIQATRTIQTNWNRFEKQPGIEKFWLVCAAMPLPELETARKIGFENNGAVGDASAALGGFLIRHSEPKPETSQEGGSERTTVRGRGDLLVKLIELKHR